MGVMTLNDEFSPKRGSLGVVTLTCGTDSQGNSFLLDKMLTTKCPFVVVLMELAHQMRIGASSWG